MKSRRILSGLMAFVMAFSLLGFAPSALAAPNSGLTLVVGQTTLSQGESARAVVDGVTGDGYAYAVDGIAYTVSSDHVVIDKDGNITLNPDNLPSRDETVTITAQVNYYADPVFVDNFEGSTKKFASSGVNSYAHSTGNAFTGKSAANPTTTAGPAVYTLPAARTGIVTAWYYDDAAVELEASGSNEAKYCASITAASGGNNLMMGVNHDSASRQWSQQYIYRPNTSGSVNGLSGITRSKGWHKLRWVVTSEGTSMYIDGVDISRADATMAYNLGAVTSVAQLIINTNWNSAAANKQIFGKYIDDFSLVALDAVAETDTVTTTIQIKGVPYAVNPSEVRFDLAYPKNVQIGVAPNLDGLSVQNGAYTLVAGTDYVTAEAPSRVVLQTSYLSTLAEGVYTLTIGVGGNDLPVTLRVVTQGKQVELSTYSMTLSRLLIKDTAVTVMPDCEDLIAIENGGVVLTEDADYYVENGVVTLTKEYLQALELGINQLVFRFPGADLTLNITVTDTLSREYYVDSQNGDDDADGMTPATAWQSLEKIGATQFAPGDKIYLHADSVWNGQLILHGSGIEGMPIILTKYGTDNPAKRPIINGGGTVPTKVYQVYNNTANTAAPMGTGAVELINEEYWEISSLEVTNTGATTAAGRAGIMIINDYNWTTGRSAAVNNADWLASRREHYYVRDCYVHDVNAGNSPKTSGGIIALGYTDDLRFENNIVINCDIEGIRNAGSHPESRDGAWTTNAFQPAMKLVMSNNYISRSTGDGMVLSQGSEGLVERNVITNCGESFFGTSVGTANYAALWMMGSDNTLLQYNEVFNNPYHSTYDGMAFDFDGYCDNNVYQYNYSHNNSGGVILYMNAQKNNVFRYNLSVNDGYTSTGTPGHVFAWGGGDNTYDGAPYIHNNTIVVGPNTRIFFNQQTNAHYVKFSNNIVTALDSLRSDFTFWNGTGNITGGFIKNNLFYPASIADLTYSRISAAVVKTGNIFEPPLLVDPAGEPSNIIENAGAANARFDASKLAGFKLQPDSPAINAGAPYDTPASVDSQFPLEEDLFGNPLRDGTPDIGIHEFSGDTTAGAPALPTEIADSGAREFFLSTGDTVTVAPVLLPENAIYKGLTYTSSASGIATCAGGVITAVGAGTATITAASAAVPALKIQYTVNVSPTGVTGVTLPSAFRLEAGKTFQFMPVVLPAAAANKNVCYHSSNTGTATVSANGLLTAVAAGETTVTVTTADGGFAARCDVTVIDPAVVAAMTSVVIDDMEIGTGVNQFTYVGSFGIDRELPPPSYLEIKGTNHYTTNSAGADYVQITFRGSKFDLIAKKSSSMAQYDIYVDGILFSRASGYSASTQRAQTVFSSPVLPYGDHEVVFRNAMADTRREMSYDALKIYYEAQPVESVETLPALSLVTGETYALAARALPQEAPQSFAYSSDNACVMVDENGLLTAVAAGTANITVTAGGKTAACVVTVLEAEPQGPVWVEIGNAVTASASGDYFTYNGGSWSTVADAAALSGSYKRMQLSSWTQGLSGAWSRLSFNGTAVELYGRKEANGGIYNLYLDGVFVAKVDTYAAAAVSNALLYKSPLLASGAHELLICATLEQSASKPTNAAAYNRFDMLLCGAKVLKVLTPPESIVVTSEGNVMTSGVKPMQMTAAIAPASANQEFVWSVANTDGTETSSAFITKEGWLSARGNGTVRVTATSVQDSSVSGYKDILMSGLAESVTANNATVAALSVTQLTGTIDPSSTKLVWSMADKGVTNAYVSPTGEFHAGSIPGTVTVKATANDGSEKSALATVTVTRDNSTYASLASGSIAQFAKTWDVSLGAVKTVDLIAFEPGSTMETDYILYTSVDGVNYTKAAEGRWGKQGTQYTAIRSTQAAYIRIVAVGDSTLLGSTIKVGVGENGVGAINTRPDTKYRPTIGTKADGTLDWSLAMSPTDPIFSTYGGSMKGKYMNDHAFYRATDGKWHLIGISGGGSGNTGGWGYENAMAHGVSDTVDGAYTEIAPFGADYRHPDGIHALATHAPFALIRDGVNYLIYRTNYYNNTNTFAVDTSLDGYNWSQRFDVTKRLSDDAEPFTTSGYLRRDYAVTQVGDTYYLYSTAIWPDETSTSKSSITCFESKDLINWTYKSVALITPPTQATTSWSEAESPFVFRYGDYFYLSLTLTNSSDATYNRTLIFASKDPTNFGTFSGDVLAPGADLVAELPVHAPEYIYDEQNNQWYISNCGWSPIFAADGTTPTLGALIAPLSFDEIRTPTQVTGVTATATSTYSAGTPAANLTDGSVSTYWRATSATGQAVTLNLNGLYEISRLVYTPISTTSYGVKDYRISVSTDGTNFTPVADIPGNTVSSIGGWGLDARKKEANFAPALATHVKLEILRANSTNLAIAELAVFGCQNSSVASPATYSFDGSANVTTSVVANGNTIVGVKNGNQMLPDDAYDASGSSLVIKKEYMSTLVSTPTFTVLFDRGAPQTLEISSSNVPLSLGDVTPAVLTVSLNAAIDNTATVSVLGVTASDLADAASDDKIYISVDGGATVALADGVYTVTFPTDTAGIRTYSVTLHIGANLVGKYIPGTTMTRTVTVTTLANQLAKPANVTLSGLGIVSFDAVAGADGYKLTLYKDGAAVAGQTDVAAVSGATDLLTVLRTQGAGSYTVTVRAYDSTRTSGASSPSEPSNAVAVSILATPAGLGWSGQTATWTVVDNAASYSVQLYREGNALGAPVSVTGLTHDFSSAMDDPGAYTFTVTAIANPQSLYLDSAVSSRSAENGVLPVITINPQPVAVTVAAGGTATFTVSASATHNAPVSYTWYRATSQSAQTGTEVGTGATLTLTNIPYADNGSYYFCVVSAPYGAVSVKSASVKLTVTIAALPAPTGIALSQTGVLTFASVPEAVGYTYTIYKNGAPVAGQVNRLTMSGVNLLDILRGCGAGSYTVRVKAVGDGLTHLNSAESEPTGALALAQLATPTGLTWNLKTALWDAVPDAGAYSVQLYKNGRAYGAPLTATESQLDLSAYVSVSAVFTYTVTAKAPALSLLVDSEPSAESNLYRDTVRLEALIKTAEEKLGGRFTDDTYAELEAAHAQALAVLADPTASQQAVNEAAARLEAAINGLVKKASVMKVEGGGLRSVKRGKTLTLTALYDGELPLSWVNLTPANISIKVNSDFSVTVTGLKSGTAMLAVKTTDGSNITTTVTISVTN